MKESKHILFRLLFLTAILFCLGLEVCTYYKTPACNTELSSELNCGENNVLSNVDSFDDDHINQVDGSFYWVEQKVFIPFSNDPFLLDEFSVQNWQPPKFS
jgi:hypothetical protein